VLEVESQGVNSSAFKDWQAKFKFNFCI
jgi:hypothetical protein